VKRYLITDSTAFPEMPQETSKATLLDNEH